MPVFVFGQYLLGTLVLLVDHALHFFVNNACRGLRIGLLERVFLVVVIVHVGQPLAHAGVGHHGVGLLRGTLQVVHGPGGDMAYEQLLGGTSAQQRAHLVEHGFLGLQHALFRQVPGSAEGTSARHDADLHQRVGKLGEPRDGGMAGLVDGYRAFLLLGHHLGLLLQSANDAVHGIEEVLLAHFLTVMAGSYQRGLVAHIGNIGTRETRRLAGQEIHIKVLVKLQGLQVYVEHLAALVQVGQIDVYLAVEASGAHQCRVEHVGAVGGSQRDDAAVGAEAVHLRQQGVQRVLTLVVAAHGGVLAAGTPHGVYLVNEDDARGLALGLFKKVAHTRGSHADEHLDEVAA